MVNLSLAPRMAEYADLAYATPDDIEQAIQADAFQFFSEDGTQAFVSITGTTATVSFRGTEPARREDWLDDLSFTKIRYRGGRVHEGFYAAAMRVAGQIIHFAARQDVEEWYITGHSLGGALAILFADHIDTQQVKGVYTFGGPRVGNREFAAWYNSRLGDVTVRFVNNNDVVTHSPPWFFFYKHVGKHLRYFDEGGGMFAFLKLSQMVWDMLGGRYFDLFEWGTDGIKDHSMTEYKSLVNLHLGD